MAGEICRDGRVLSVAKICLPCLNIYEINNFVIASLLSDLGSLDCGVLDPALRSNDSKKNTPFCLVYHPTGAPNQRCWL